MSKKRNLIIFTVSFATIFIVLLFYLFQLRFNSSKLIISPDDAENKIISLIDSAKESVYIENYYFTNEKIAFSLINAKNRGVKVKVLMEKNEGVEKVYNILISNGIEAKIDENSRLIHAKVIVIDEEIIIVGSHNLTKAAMKNNREISVVLFDRDLAKELIKIFEEDFSS